MTLREMPFTTVFHVLSCFAYEERIPSEEGFIRYSGKIPLFEGRRFCPAPNFSKKGRTFIGYSQAALTNRLTFFCVLYIMKMIRLDIGASRLFIVKFYQFIH